ncbi:MAG: hypothetical protein ACREA0_29830, partial [bacterium]
MKKIKHHLISAVPQHLAARSLRAGVGFAMGMAPSLWVGVAARGKKSPPDRPRKHWLFRMLVHPD